MIRMMNSSDDFIGPVNLGNPNEFTILDLAENILSITKSKSKVIFQPLPQDDPMKRRPDISLAKMKLNGWSPKVELKEGLLTTISHFSDLLKV